MPDIALFDVAPAAMVYHDPAGVPLSRMRCRECHRRGAIGGGGSNGKYSYAVCQSCFQDRGETGCRARRPSTRGRELIVIEPEGSES